MSEIMIRGSQPSGWEKRMLGQVFRERREKGSDSEFPALSVTMQGILPQLETAAKTDRGDDRKVVRVGDYVINSRSDRKGSGGISALEGSVSLISIVMEPVEIVPKFAHHLLRSVAFQEEFYRFGRGIVADLWSTRFDDLKRIQVFLPSKERQAAIAFYLDRETARIDALIEKKIRFIELLKEKRQALITQAVTKGLDPNVPMRDSGVEWIGEVPEGWTVSKLKRLGRLKGGAGFPPAMQGQTGMEIGFYKVGDLGRSSDGITLSSAQHTISREMASKIGARIFAPGSLCWAKIGAALSLNRRRLISTNACLDNNMTGFTCDERVASSRYMLHLMSVVDFSVHAKPGAVPSFSEGDQGELPMPVPPIEEQMEIAEYIDRTESKMHTLMMRVENSIDLLKERRSALITAAVTGQIDLREAA